MFCWGFVCHTIDISRTPKFRRKQAKLQLNMSKKALILGQIVDV